MTIKEYAREKSKTAFVYSRSGCQISTKETKVEPEQADIIQKMISGALYGIAMNNCDIRSAAVTAGFIATQLLPGSLVDIYETITNRILQFPINEVEK